MKISQDTFRAKATAIEETAALLQRICLVALDPQKLLDLVEKETKKIDTERKELFNQGVEAGLI